MTLQPDDPEIHAEEAGLRYLTDDVPGVRRRRAGKGFVYIGLDGKRVTDPDRIAWFKRLAVPPAWTDVWISPIKRGHVQATGRDARGRKQYRYHPRWRAVRDRRLARLVRECHELPGQELFQYLDEDGKRQSIDSGAVNDYLREISGEDFTTKDFRTWAGTVAASLALAEFLEIDDDAGRKKAIVRAIEEVAEQLGNTPACVAPATSTRICWRRTLTAP